MTATVSSSSTPAPEPADAGSAASARATVADEVSPVPRHDLPVLEAFRGIASVMVVLTHVGFTSGAGQIGPWAGWLSRLDFGVTLFFLLSGFLLFRPYVQAAYGRRPPVATRSYLRRRLVRIYPAFVLVVAVVYLIGPDARRASASLWLQTLFLVQNYPSDFISQVPGLVQTWSLCVEVSFYVALPLIAWLALGRGTAMARASARALAARSAVTPVTSRRAARERRRQPLLQRALGTSDVVGDLTARRPAIVLAALAALAVAYRLYYLVETHGLAHQMLWLPPFLDWFAAGMALAWLRERDAPVPLWIRYLAQFPGVCWSMALAAYWLATTSLAGPYGLEGAATGAAMFKHLVYIVVAVLMLVPAVFGDPAAAWRRAAANRFFTWLGQISFAVFLWHPMLMALVRRLLGLPELGGYFWLTLTLTLGLSFAIGTLSWRYVEEPLQRRYRNGFRAPSSSPTPGEPAPQPNLATN